MSITIFGQVEKLELVPVVLELQVEVLHLDGHGLVVVDEGRLLLLTHSDLLHQVLSRHSLVLGVLAHGETFVGFDQLALGVHDHGLELISLPNQLLAVCVDLLLQLQVLPKECVPLPLATPLTPLVLFQKSFELTQLL